MILSNLNPRTCQLELLFPIREHLAIFFSYWPQLGMTSASSKGHTAQTGKRGHVAPLSGRREHQHRSEQVWP